MPYADEDARRRFEEGDVVLLQNVPVATEVAIDITVYTTAERFRGWKMVPPGLHLLVHTSATGSESRIGEFVITHGRGTLIRHWDEKEECLSAGQGCSDTHASELARAARSLYFDSQLAPYPAETLAAWQRITFCLSDEVLSRCSIPPGTRIVPGDPDARPGERNKQLAMIPYFSNSPGAPNFSDAAVRKPAHLQPQDVTAYNFGAGSERLHTVLRHSFDGRVDLFVGEFQLAFVLFLMLTSLRAFEQWKRMLEVISLPDVDINEFADLYYKLAFSTPFLW